MHVVSTRWQTGSIEYAIDHRCNLISSGCSVIELQEPTKSLVHDYVSPTVTRIALG